MTKGHEPDRSDWILLALRAAADQALTAVKLQKTLFLLGERRPDDVGDYYAFEPYHYGPFDADVYRDADVLEFHGLVDIDHSRGRALRRYVLTDRGAKTADKAAAHYPRNALDYLERVVKWVEPLPFNVLVRAIYNEFPRMRAKSIFEDR